MSTINSINDLKRLPIITADQFRAATQRGETLATSVEAGEGQRFSTGGSTGIPLEVRRGSVEARLWRTAGLSMQLEHGFSWSDTTVQFDVAPHQPHPLQKLGIAPSIWIDPKLPIEVQMDLLLQAKPSVIHGHVTVLRAMAKALIDRSCQLHNPLTIFSVAELLDKDSRDTIRAGFGVDPTDVYGMTEVGFIAWQCEVHQQMHVNAELVIVEILGEDGPAQPGELGRVVVTDLRGRTMPAIRYDTGDLARASEPCVCGRSLPSIGPLEGRARQAIVRPDGSTITPLGIMNHLSSSLRTGEYCLQRISEHQFLLRITSQGLFPGKNAHEICQELEDWLGGCEVKAEIVTGFPKGLKTHSVVDLRNSLSPLPDNEGCMSTAEKQ
ncbi:phenylacetate--CoA ligase family protein [Synechococcus sp. Cruz-9H2]|uniref:phenylacetate--CoA ligase family protein n=1 Tax=unclassified Synechococcus TaxID=2626047 RepID=UPI0020CEC4A1|nr:MULTISPECIES: hypothetical protein [unclassified Synechococcus]MCP9820361.1 phenylacetate--CoA ligase family protein [Synechococcus sp. Cruz-9H2]MCP9844669.1 phenylacetate--CoA ligase family protein [Synechococcus sp. Edmonson 11F2]MCP9856791.1 phenylacetate--CoA ligase family protein [Synechococcus sp. Cruz-9C9]MCP9863999.1 phenylacetate--CoA ligase family protein [Synechococcus sp. Cruz-7E5]MCP9871194.1 phenylacetate--CoA ligase family protein [Synechococcus sp. Cruz-7B9]